MLTLRQKDKKGIVATLLVTTVLDYGISLAKKADTLKPVNGYDPFCRHCTRGQSRDIGERKHLLMLASLNRCLL